MSSLAARVSAVIPHYGNAEPTLALVQNLHAQVYEGDIEIIISDDNSPLPFPSIDGVRVVRRQKNGGFGQNANTGVAKATGQWLIILNSDLEIDEYFVADMVSEAQKQAHAVLSPQVLGHDGIGQYVARKFPRTFFHAWNWFTPLARFRDTQWWHRYAGHDIRAESGKTVRTDWLMGACLMMPLSAFRQVGGFDDRFFMNSEEVDLQRRLKDAGYPAVFVGNVQVLHEGGGSSESSKRRQWLTESYFIYEDKWTRHKTLAPTLTAVSLLNLGFNSLRALRNSSVSPLKTFGEEITLIRQGKNKVYG